jgi:hypothetical protein
MPARMTVVPGLAAISASPLAPVKSGNSLHCGGDTPREQLAALRL